MGINLTLEEAMPKDLVIVESPTKARTIGRFLGNGYETLASMGHVRDLSDKKVKNGVNGVEVDEEGFHPSYTVMSDKKKVVSHIRKAAKTAETVYLATDPDREGEAISWHLVEAANVPRSKIKRVVFHEITNDAINEAFNEPKDIDYDLVNAQQARRILDRLVGYRLSPVLWSKVKRGLSAGRVQSVALRLVVDREAAIEAFVPVEYWNIESKLSKRGIPEDEQATFSASLYAIKGQKKIEILNGGRATELVHDISGADFTVVSVTTRETRRRPAPPFITSTLQQEASRKLRFTASRTMRIAQQLYEGIKTDNDGEVGLITYMRTDSTNVADSALVETQGFIKQNYGNEYTPAAPRTYTKKVKGAQEAHEAIRPTSTIRTPESIRQHLDNDQFRLYDLIWKRLVASQMSDALFDSTRVGINAQSHNSDTEYEFRASGSVSKFSGFRILYTEGTDDDAADNNEKQPLPELYNGEPLDCQDIAPSQHFTQPPPRFTDATLVKSLEEQGIGRPSTYAPTIATILDKDYVEKLKGRFFPTKLGRVVTDFLTPNFPEILDIRFTAKMEERLDDIANGEIAWEPMLKEFYGPFDESIKKAMSEVERVPREMLDEQTDDFCDDCGKPMVIKSGRFGKFYACTGYPDCKTTKPFETDEERIIRESVPDHTDELCDNCEKPMSVRNGRNGRFLACTGYPDCKNAKPLPVGLDCPQCGSILVERKKKGNNGSVFFSCPGYPACKFTVNPVPKLCPDCGKLLVAQGRGRNKQIQCLGNLCEYTVGAESA